MISVRPGRTPPRAASSAHARGSIAVADEFVALTRQQLCLRSMGDFQVGMVLLCPHEPDHVGGLCRELSAILTRLCREVSLDNEVDNESDTVAIPSYAAESLARDPV